MEVESYARYLLGIYSAMLVDIAVEYPYLRVDCSRDYKRLLSAVNARGLPFIMVDLPAMAKHFDICLDQSRLTPSSLAHQGPWKKGSPIPRLFKGLMIRVFDSSGLLRVDPDKRCIFLLRSLYLLGKRFRMQCPDSSTWKQVDEFVETDRAIRPPSLDWDRCRIDFGAIGTITLCDSDGPLFPRPHIEGRDPFSILLNRALWGVQYSADVVSSELGEFIPTEWRTKHGPGAVSDLASSGTKYHFKHWPEKLSRVFDFPTFGLHNLKAEILGYAESRLHPRPLEHEVAAKLIAVPKTLSAPRLIASEPVCHQWCQQAILDYLVTRVRQSSIASSVSFSSQKGNADLALESSHSQSHWTIDLSSASDRISCWLIERVFRRNPSALEAFMSVRTRFIFNGIDKKHAKLIRLRKFSTMGSALTFPVQTILFTTIAIGCILALRGLPLSAKSIRMISKEVRVYGDDIIVPIDAGLLVSAVLEHLGLKVNRNKTFGTGKFRESCGCDAFDGYDVTKVSVLSMPKVSRPESIMSAVDTHNNFLSKGLYETAAFIKSTVDRMGVFSIPTVAVGSGVFGWHSFNGFESGRLKRRYNPDLQRLEYSVHTLLSKSVRTSIEDDSTLLQYFTEVCKPPISREERLGVASRPTNKLVRRWVPWEALAFTG